MNQVFNFNRWLLFTGKHWAENKKRYLLGLVAIAALLIIWYSIVLLVEATGQPLSYELQLITYHVGLFGVGLLYASFLFHDLSESPKGIHYLLIPASVTEKMLTAILFGLVLFFICYTAIYYAVDTVMVNLANSNADRIMLDMYGNPVKQKVVNVFTGPSHLHDDYVFLYLILIYLALHTAFMLGSVYFPKYSFIKTAISILLIFLCFVLLVAQILDAIMPPGDFDNSIIAYRIIKKGQEQVVMLPRLVLDIIYFCFRFGFPPVFIIATWFRLKEKEV